jgi:mannose-6-phosphate isomerase-like protein (cupin superfamily)
VGREPVVVNADDREWETWPAHQVAQRGRVWWKTLISAGTTESSALTLGVARLPPGATLREHRHEQPEVYFVLEGSGVVTIDGSTRRVDADAGVFIPSNAAHSIKCTGGTDLRVAYAFAADAFEDVEYVFSA